MIAITWTRNAEGGFNKSGELPEGCEEVQLQQEGLKPFGSYTPEAGIAVIEDAIAKGKAPKDKYAVVAVVKEPRAAKAPKVPSEPKAAKPVVAKEPKKPKYNVDEFKALFIELTTNPDTKTSVAVKAISAKTGASTAFISWKLKEANLISTKPKVAVAA